MELNKAQKCYIYFLTIGGSIVSSSVSIQASSQKEAEGKIAEYAQSFNAKYSFIGETDILESNVQPPSVYSVFASDESDGQSGNPSYISVLKLKASFTGKDALEIAKAVYTILRTKYPSNHRLHLYSETPIASKTEKLAFKDCFDYSPEKVLK